MAAKSFNTFVHMRKHFLKPAEQIKIPCLTFSKTKPITIMMAPDRQNTGPST